MRERRVSSWSVSVEQKSDLLYSFVLLARRKVSLVVEVGTS